MAALRLISICIPAYKRTDFLKRLLDSVAIQTFRDFEVIITDDSNDNSVSELCRQYQERFPLKYIKNANALGTPENWNEAVRHAQGVWTKIMHDDDWFYNEHSLEKYMAAVRNNPEASFFFSAYQNVWVESGKTAFVYASQYRLNKLQKTPVTLFSTNIIGPPSVTLYRHNTSYYFDSQLKWLVDIDFYILFLQQNKAVYLREVLVNIGISQEQVTKAVYKNRPVEIPESFSLFNKTGPGQLRNVLIYDAWWRLLRKLAITREAEIREAGYQGSMHPIILSMISWQRAIPRAILTTGIFSKMFMLIHYLLHSKKAN